MGTIEIFKIFDNNSTIFEQFLDKPGLFINIYARSSQYGGLQLI